MSKEGLEEQLLEKKRKHRLERLQKQEEEEVRTFFTDRQLTGCFYTLWDVASCVCLRLSCCRIGSFHQYCRDVLTELADPCVH